MSLPGDPNLPPGCSTRDTDGPQGSGVTCPKCGSDNVSELNDPDLLCCDCDHDWERGKEDESGPSEHTCPKCGSREVSDLHAPDLWCSNCDYEWDMRRPGEQWQSCDLCGQPSNDIVITIPNDGPICRKCWDKHAAKGRL